MTRTGRTGGGRTDCGGRADRRTWGKGEADGRTGERHGDWRRMDGRADRRMRADGARIGWTSGRADGRTSKGLKGPAPRSPLHSRAPRLLTSLQSEFVGRLGVHWGPPAEVMLFFFCSKQHICNSDTALL